MTIFDEQLQIFKIRETLVTRALRDYMKLDKTNVTITRDYLINDVLVGFDYFSIEDATFAVDHMDVNFDEQAVLYVKQNSSGQSRGGITEMMRYYGYTEEQINNALEETGI